MKAERSELKTKGESAMMTAKQLETMTEPEIENLKRETYRAFLQASSPERVFFLADLENLSRREAAFLRGPS